MLSKNIIYPEGKLKSKIMLIGEAPGRDEDKEGRPFVGNAGHILNTALNNAGLIREDCFITNVLNRRPPDNYFGDIAPWELSEHKKRLIKEVDKCEANVLVPLGSNALEALTGYYDIQDYRGSILERRVGNRIRKIVPSVHPAWVLRQYLPGMTFIIQDLKRAKEQSISAGIDRLPRNWYVPRNAKEVAAAVLALEKSGEWLASDIESKKDGLYIYCVGFAGSATDAYSFFLQPSCFTDGDKGATASRGAVEYLLKGPQKLIFQNGSNFDMQMLRYRGFEVNGYSFDTFLASHQMYPELPRSLKVLNSFYTDMPFYKDMMHDATTHGSMNHELLGEYNCYDCMVTYEIAMRQMSQLSSWGGMAFHKKFYMDLVDPLVQAALDGVRIDVDVRSKLSAESQLDLDAIAGKLRSLLPKDFMPKIALKRLSDIEKQVAMYERTGTPTIASGKPRVAYVNWCRKRDEFSWEFNPSSSAQVIDVLYSDNGFATKKIWEPSNKGGARNLTADNEALAKIVREQQRKSDVKEFARVLLEHRSLDKLISSYLNTPVDKDGRVRCTYNLGVAKTGRLSSSKSIFGTGMNLQTIPKRSDASGKIRKLFLPDEGDVFVSGDLSQAEARIVAGLAGEHTLIQRFNEGKGVFEYVASSIYGVAEDAVSKDQRSTAKTLVHGTNYGMEEDKFARTAGIHLEEAERIWRRYCVRFPRLELWRDGVKEVLKRRQGRELITPLGRKRVLLDRGATPTVKGGWKFNMNYVRDCWSYVPQSTIGDGLNLGGIVKTMKVIQKRAWKVHVPKLRLQIHDQVVYSTAPQDADAMKAVLEKTLPMTLTIKGKEIHIPAEVEIGESLGEV